MKIGMRGVTITVSSGDAGAPGRTNEDCGSDDPDPNIKKVNPVFPGSSPWVTSVGGTFIVEDNSTRNWDTYLCKNCCLVRCDLMNGFSAPLKTNEFTGDTFVFGADDQGRDIFSTILYGMRISLFVGFSAVLFAMVLGVFLGLIAAMVGGITDAIIMRIADMVLAMPSFLIALVLLSVKRFFRSIGALHCVGLLTTLPARLPTVQRNLRVNCFPLRAHTSFASTTGSSNNSVKCIQKLLMIFIFLHGYGV